MSPCISLCIYNMNEVPMTTWMDRISNQIKVPKWLPLTSTCQNDQIFHLAQNMKVLCLTLWLGLFTDYGDNTDRNTIVNDDEGQSMIV